MARNGKVEEQQLDVEYELPAAEEGEKSTSAQASAPTELVSELEKLQIEHDSLLDHLTHMQTEFDNTRKRTVKEQQDFRDYTLVDTIKTIIPMLDSFDLALKNSPEKSEFHT